jgi:hypothetical protein
MFLFRLNFDLHISINKNLKRATIFVKMLNIFGYFQHNDNQWRTFNLALKGV